MKVVIDDFRLERMDVYTDPLNDKIKRQAAEITRLLAENEELKKGREAIRDNAFEAGLIRGQEEAWKLAQKITLDSGYSMGELKEIFNSTLLTEILDLTYAEAAAKVAEREKAKEEICVGDVVECEGSYGVVVGVEECYIKGFTSDWTPFQWMKQSCTKTGRHIDIASMLAQIGGEHND